jgi:hypothetical protein
VLVPVLVDPLGDHLGELGLELAVAPTACEQRGTSPGWSFGLRR